MSLTPVLPRQVDYSERPPQLVEAKNLTQKLAPVNGSTFSANSQIIFDFPARGFLDGKSLYLSYNISLAGLGSDAAKSGVCACPAYAPIQRLDIFFNNQLVDTVNDYNQVCSMWSNVYLGVNEKYGVQSALGYADATATTATLDEIDGRVVVTSTTASYVVSCPVINNLLANAEKFIPAFALGNIRIVFTLENSVSNFTTQAAGTSGTMSITNAELTYDIVDFGGAVEQEILAMDKLTIKSASYANSSATLSSGATGQQTLVFNQRLKSIRSAIVHPSPGKSTVFVNGKFDAVNCAKTGSYQLQVGGYSFPQGGAINMGNNRSGALMELRKATGQLMDWSKPMAINTQEFSVDDSAAADSTSITQPGKCYIGFDLNKINSSSTALLNGTSSTDSPINLVMNISSATNTSYNVALILQYDAIIHIDPRMRQAVVEY